MVNYIAIIGIGAINVFTLVSFIITLCTKSKNKKFACYMHLLFWLVFNITVFIVGILPELNKLIEEFNKINVIY